MLSLGLDIGGANTKAVLFKDEKVEDYWYEFIPLWRERGKLTDFLKNLSKTVNPKRIGITMTAELCDEFESKEQGVEKIVRMILGPFSDEKCYFFSIDGNLIKGRDALDNIERLGASNWVSSALLVGRKYPNCLLLDVGSTTTDLIPIEKGEPVPDGWTDYERLKTGELVYTGLLRTSPSFLASEITLAGDRVEIASEHFTNTADVYRILGLISKEDYKCETPDGRGKDKENCMKRLARVFCSDITELGKNLIVEAANSFYDLQASKISENLLRVSNIHDLSEDTRIVVTGIGRKILGEKAAIISGFDYIYDIDEIYCEEAAVMTPAYAVGLLTGEKEYSN